jgi:hypothetical protein
MPGPAPDAGYGFRQRSFSGVTRDLPFALSTIDRFGISPRMDRSANGVGSLQNN